MKIYIYIINFMLILGIVLYLTIVGIQSTKPMIVSVELEEKTLKSSDLLAYAKNIESVVSKEIDSDSEVDLDDSEDKEETIIVSSDNTIENDNVNQEIVVSDDSSLDDKAYVSDVLETQVGSLSGYGPDCYGCIIT